MVLVLSQLLTMEESPLLQSFDGWLTGREAEFEASIKIVPALVEHGEWLVLKDSWNKSDREEITAVSVYLSC